VNKYVLHYIPAAASVFCRTVGAGLILYLFVHKEIVSRRPKRGEIKAILILSLFGIVFNMIAFMEGMQRTTATHASVINASVPILTLLFSVFLRTEKLNIYRFSGMVMCITGILYLSEIEKMQWQSELFVGDMLCALNSAFFSFYLALSRKIAKGIPPMVVTTGMFVFGAIILLPYSGPAFFNVSWDTFPPLFFAALFYLVVASSVITYFLNNWALARVESSAVGIYIYLQPIIAGCLSYLIFDERLTPRMILASLLVFSGVAIGNFWPLKQKKKEIYAEPHVS